MLAYKKKTQPYVPVSTHNPEEEDEDQYTYGNEGYIIKPQNAKVLPNLVHL